MKFADLATCLDRMEAARSRYKLVKTLAELYAKTRNPLDLIFTREDGGRMDGTVVTHQFHRLLDQAHVDQRRFHDLGHSCATLLLAQGVPARVVMEILGHSQIALTMHAYAHVIPELRRNAAERRKALIQER